MAAWSFKWATWTPVAVADATNYTDNGYMGLMGGSTTQMGRILEIYMGGQNAASAVMEMIFSRDSTVQATPTALTTGQSLAAFHPSTAALGAPPVAFTASTTKPQRSATLGLLNLSFNAFGSVVKWYTGQEEYMAYLGNTASIGEMSLSGYTGTAVGASIGAHIIFEPF
jgi:hypothetical protein